MRRFTLAALAAVTLAAGCSRYQTARPTDSQYDSRPKQVPQESVAVQALLNGRKMLDQGRQRDALVEFEKAIESNPLLIGAYMAAGDIYLQQGDNQMAALRFERAANLAPGSFDAQFKFGHALQLLGQLADAVRQYLKALAIKPTDFQANMNLGVAYLQLNDPESALKFAQQAVKINPRDSQARTNLASVFSALGRYDDAVTEYLQSAELAPAPPEVLLNLADNLSKAGQFEQAVNTLEQLVRSMPSALAYERMGTANFRLKRYEESETAFRKALEIDNKHYPALNGVAVCLLNKYVWGEYADDSIREEAIKLLRESNRIEPRQPRIQALYERYKNKR